MSGLSVMPGNRSAINFGNNDLLSKELKAVRPALMVSGPSVGNKSEIKFGSNALQSNAPVRYFLLVIR